MTSNLLQFVEVGELAADALCNIYQLHLRGGREGGREGGRGSGREGGRGVELLSKIRLRARLSC